MGKGGLSRDDELVVQSEFQRVKKQPDTVKVKKKKITAQNIGVTRASGALTKYKKTTVLSKDVKALSAASGDEGTVGEDIGKNLKSINGTLDNILKSIVSQGKDDKKRREKERTSGERRRAQERESGLEKPIQFAKKLANKVIAPFRGLLDSVFRFLGFTFLGWLIGKFDNIQKWTEQNKTKIDVVKRFLKDWWPSLLFAAGLFLTPFGAFVRGTIKMLRFFIPQIIKFMAAHPFLTAAAAAGIGAYAAVQINEQKREEFKKTDPSIVTPKETKETGKTPGIPQLQQEQSLQRGLGGMFSRGGRLPFFGFKNGANLGDYFSGYVDQNSGASVTGFGQDTQAFPVEGGGAAVLKPGEVVMNTGAVSAIGADKLLSWNKQFGGPNANRPVNFTFNGGGIVGFRGGGILGRSRPSGLGYRGVRAGFTGMGPQGYSAISSGEGYKLPTQKSLFGKGSSPVLGRGAYNAPTMRGAGRYKKPGGGIIKTIVPRGAVGSSLVDIIEPQSRVKPSTFDKGKRLADRLASGRYANSRLANQLRGQLSSGQAVSTMTKASGLGRGAAALRLLGGLGKLASKFTRIPLLMDMLFPDPTSAYDQVSGPNAYYNAPGYRGPKPLGKQDGGAVTGVRGGFTTRFGGQVGQMFGLTGGVDFKSGKTTGSANAMLGYGNTMERTSAQQAVTEGLTSTQFGGKWGGIPYALPTSGTDVKEGLIGALNASLSGVAGITPTPKSKSKPEDDDKDPRDPKKLRDSKDKRDPKPTRGKPKPEDNRKDPEKPGEFILKKGPKPEPVILKKNKDGPGSPVVPGGGPAAQQLSPVIDAIRNLSPSSQREMQYQRNLGPSVVNGRVQTGAQRLANSGLFDAINQAVESATIMNKKVGKFNKGGVARFMKAGRVSTTTGIDIKGGVMGADTQYTPPMALKPGESLYVIPSQAAPQMDKAVAQLDRNSSPAKNQSNLKPAGPRISFMNLPDKITSPPQKSGGGLTPGKPNLPEFGVIMDSPKRMEVAAALGISDLV